MSEFYGAVGVIIENGNEEILMVQEGKDHIHGSWDFPGGGWEDEESILDCAKREVLEETGYKVEITGFLGVYKEPNQKDGTETIAFMFKGTTISRVNEEPENIEEIIDAKFFTPQEIQNLELRVENRRTILEKYLNGEEYSLTMLWNNLNKLE